MSRIRAFHLPSWVVVWAALCAAVPGLASLAGAAEIVDPGQGAVEIPRRRSGATGLSGITHLGGDAFLAVSDRGRRLFALHASVHPATGRIANVRIERSSVLASARDTEGVVSSGPDAVWVCDEIGPALREHRVSDGSVIRTIAVPSVFALARNNLSLEGLALEPGAHLWIANEEALRVDGPKASATEGSIVRLQRFDATEPRGPGSTEPRGPGSTEPRGPGSTDRPTPWIAAAQWAYRTDPIPGGAVGGYERSGVVDLVALPGAALLVLERGLGTGGLRSRIYEVDFDGASDISRMPSLDRGVGGTVEFTAVRKRLLWEATALGDNFEGVALGVTLASGDRSLILISDDGGATLPRLYPLRIRISSQPGSGDAPGSGASGVSPGGLRGVAGIGGVAGITMGLGLVLGLTVTRRLRRRRNGDSRRV